MIDHLHISPNAPRLEANVRVLLRKCSCTVHTELKYPYIGFQSRCIMEYGQMVYLKKIIIIIKPLALLTFWLVYKTGEN